MCTSMLVMFLNKIRCCTLHVIAVQLALLKEVNLHIGAAYFLLISFLRANDRSDYSQPKYAQQRIGSSFCAEISYYFAVVALFWKEKSEIQTAIL